MSTTSINSLSGLTSPPPSTSSTQTASSSPASASSLANEDVFLQLLVAQLKNQDPENPADGTAFVTQLAQFTSLGEETQSASDLNSILKLMQTPASTPPPATSTGTAGTSAGGSSTTNPASATNPASTT